jgi:predicted ATP-grasp superfamily ATP-dependent carboligase
VDEIPESLRREGRAMLQAIAADWSVLPDWEVVVSWDSRFGECEIAGANVRLVNSSDSHRVTWPAIVKEVDLALVIAPEIDDQLCEVIQALRSQGACLLNADARFLEAASDKWFTAEGFQRAKIAHPRTALLSEVFGNNGPKAFDGRGCHEWTLKPRDGAGCHRISRFRSFDDVKRYVEKNLPRTSDRDRFILQPWIAGEPGSVAVLCGPDQACVLPPMRQSIALTDMASSSHVEYGGGTGPWPAISQNVLDAFALTVLQSFPGSPLGWVGIDFVVPESNVTAESIVAIEVNPRLTTSYLGARKMVAENLADLIFRAASGQSVAFSPSGRSIAFDSFGNTHDHEL